MEVKLEVKGVKYWPLDNFFKEINFNLGFKWHLALNNKTLGSHSITQIDRND